MTPYADRIAITKGIWSAASSDEQRTRLTDAYDQYPSFGAALDTMNFTVARAKILQALNDAIIIQADYDLVIYHLDLAENIITL